MRFKNELIAGNIQDEYLKKEDFILKCFSNKKIVKIKRWNFNTFKEKAEKEEKNSGCWRACCYL